jgi:hypothetical protein
MMYGQERSSNVVVFSISILLIIGTYLLWWTNTVIAVLLLIGATFLILSTMCNVCTQGLGNRMATAGMGVQRRRSLSRAFEEEMERQRRSIPGHMDPSLLPKEIPLEVLEGPNSRQVDTLMRVGVAAISDLIYFGAESIVDVCDVDLKEAQKWVADARGIYEIAGLKTLDELASANPSVLAEQLLDAAETGVFDIPERYVISIEKTSYWIDAAVNMLK